MVNDQEYEDALYNKDNAAIMNSVCGRFSASLSQDVLHRCKLMALWKALEFWKPEKKGKFTTFLYQRLYWECVKEIKLKNKQRATVSYVHTKTYDKMPIFEILDGLSSEYKDILTKKYVENMTLHEIGNIYGCSHETIRRKIKKAIKSVKILENGV